MKEFIIYLHSANSQETLTDYSWLNKFSQNLKNALEKYDIRVNAFTENKDSFLQSIDASVYGLYLPIISRDFINSQECLFEFTHVKDEIENRFAQNAFHLSLIEDIIPINYAHFQPFFKFYNQGQFSQNIHARHSNEFLPGNNTLQSFQQNTQSIAKEISDQLLKILFFNTEKKKVFIGTSTNDLEGPLKSLYNFLIEQNIDVITPFATSNLTKSYIEKKLTQNIKQCWLCIHPFGSEPFPPNSQLNDNTNICKLESLIASKHFFESQSDQKNNSSFRRIIWLPKKVSSSTYEGRIIDWVKMYTLQNKDGEILECSLDELKRIIVDYNNNYLSNDDNNFRYSANHIKAIDKADYKMEKPDTETVFVIHEHEYTPYLNDLSTILSKSNLNVITTKDLENKADFLQEKTASLENCKGVILLASSWNSVWFTSNMNEVLKIKSIRENRKYDFICVMSKEISQLPFNFDKDLTLITINGAIDGNMVTTKLINSIKQ